MVSDPEPGLGSDGVSTILATMPGDHLWLGGEVAEDASDSIHAVGRCHDALARLDRHAKPDARLEPVLEVPDRTLGLWDLELESFAEGEHGPVRPLALHLVH